jgi:tetratricopeptide (TPR) repeat protein
LELIVGKLPMSLFGFRRPQLATVLRIGLLLFAAVAGAGNRYAAGGQRHAAKPAGGDAASANAALLNRAKKLVQDGDPQGAISLLETADLHGPHAADVHALKGVCLALLGRPVESANEFDTAIALRPNDAPTYFSAGLASASFDNLDRALNLLAAALKLEPNLPAARYNEALVLARAGRFAESDQQVQLELRNPHRTGESTLDLWRLMARDAYYQKRWPEALEAYRKALELDPNWPEAYGAMGEALFSLNRSAESLPMLEKSEALDPGNATTHALLGKIYQDAGKTQRAIAELEWARRLRPDDQDAIFRLHRLYSQSGDTASASRTLKLLKDLIAARYNESIGETKASPLNNAGLELEKQGNLTGALDDFDRAAKEDATNLIFQRNAALILCKLGRMEEAIRRLRDILELDPDDAQTLQILSVAKEYELKRSVGLPGLPSLEGVR